MTDYHPFQCPECAAEALIAFSVNEDKAPVPVDYARCDFCGHTWKLPYSADNRPDKSDWIDSGDTITVRTPYAFEWWRHNKEFFVYLRYAPRRLRRNDAA